jgi:hypothetical protein
MQDRTYRGGRNAALGIYVIPSVLTAPILLFFSVDPVQALLEGAFAWTCLLVIVTIIHGGVAIGTLTAASRRRAAGDEDRADGMVCGWIYGLAANIVFFQLCALLFEVVRLLR